MASSADGLALRLTKISSICNRIGGRVNYKKIMILIT
jgi:hypothetical protein